MLFYHSPHHSFTELGELSLQCPQTFETRCSVRLDLESPPSYGKQRLSPCVDPGECVTCALSTAHLELRFAAVQTVSDSQTQASTWLGWLA